MKQLFIITKPSLAVIGMLAMAATSIALEPPITPIVVRVVNETGAPVTNALVHATSYWRPRQLNGYTDDAGVFRYEDKLYGAISCFIEKDGWYKSGGEMWPGPRTLNDHPTNALVVVLKKIINPVPMEFHRVATDLPKLGVSVPFDLSVGDWTAPYGKGVEKDVWFSGERSFVSRRDHDVRVLVTFSNNVDGVQAFTAPHPSKIPFACDLMPPQKSPLLGYTNSLSLWQNWHPGKPFLASRQENQNYVFRVRSITNEVGNILQANVGWIEEDFQVDPGKGQTVLIMFKYYYNPDPNSRSLEPKVTP